MTTLLLLIGLGQAPAFTVENKCPPTFTVVNMTPRKTATPGVVAKPTFQGPRHHAGHDCPSCGRQQWVVESGIANVAGHTHRCRSCGTTWWH